jgi:cobaltochelatase CobS
MTIQATDLKNAKRYLTIKGIDKNGLDDVDIVSTAIGAGWMPSAPSFDPVSIPPQVMSPARVPVELTFDPTPSSSVEPRPLPIAPRVNAPANDATAKALTALMDSLQSSTPLDEKRIIELIKQHATTVTTLETYNVPSKISVKIEGAHKELKRVVSRLNAGYNVYCYGPAGSGKTTLAAQAATALNLDFYHTGALLMKYELTGYNDAGGNYVSTTFYECYKNGGLFLFDEIDASNPQAVTAFNQAIENGEMTFPCGLVKVHKDFKVIAAANTAGTGATNQYKRNALDGATLDRFARIELQYDLDLEVRLAIAEYQRIAGNDANLSPAYSFITTVQQAREKAAEKRIDVIISPRSSIRGCGIIAMGDTVKMAINECFGASLSVDQLKQLGL